MNDAKINVETAKPKYIEYEQGIARLGGNEILYKKLLVSFLKDDCFSRLKAAYTQKKYNDMFLAAHELKGVAGNLSLNRLYNDICPLVELLRANNYFNLNNAYEKAEKTYQNTIDALIKDKEK